MGRGDHAPPVREGASARDPVAGAVEDTGQLLEKILDHTQTLIACLDRNLDFVRVNRAYAAADRKDPSFYPGKSHFALYPNAENERIFREVLATGVTHTERAKPFVYAYAPEAIDRGTGAGAQRSAR